jgi:Carboxypeptidase regulatory-like domain
MPQCTRYITVGACLACFLILSAPRQAQVNLATVVGTVKDPSGAVVPDAKVTITNIERATSTAASGYYTITNLAVGHYSLTVSRIGFKTYTIPEIDLQVGQSVRKDVALQVGAATQKVTVSAASPLISTTTSDVGQVVSRQVCTPMLRVPRNGRSRH